MVGEAGELFLCAEKLSFLLSLFFFFGVDGGAGELKGFQKPKNDDIPKTGS